MKENPIISIIIPLYNKEKFILRCLDSIFEDYNEHFEIIVVNDGSTDKSLSILYNYKHISKISIIHKDNGGVSSARNRGIYEARGEWVLFMDADDCFMKGWFQKLSVYINAYSSFNVLIANYLTVNNDGNVKKSMNCIKDKIVIDPLKELWYREIYSRPGNTIIKKKVFSIIGYYDETISYNEDLEFSIRLLSYYKVVILPFVIMKYYKTTNSASSFFHSFEKDFISRLYEMSRGSIWKELILYNVYLFHKKRNPNGTNIKSPLPAWFNLIYSICIIDRKLFKFFI